MKGDHEKYCSFLSTLRNCGACRKDFSLSIKCDHFGKKKKDNGHKNVFFLNNDVGGANNLYVKCGYCSDFYLRGCANSHSCFLKLNDSLFGDASKRLSMICAHNVFFFMISKVG